MLRIGLILLIVPCLLLMGVFMYEQSIVSGCLELGGSFDYELLSCDQENTHAFMPYMERHPQFVNGGMLLSVVGLFFCMIGLCKRR